MSIRIFITYPPFTGTEKDVSLYLYEYFKDQLSWIKKQKNQGPGSNLLQKGINIQNEFANQAT